MNLARSSLLFALATAISLVAPSGSWADLATRGPLQASSELETWTQAIDATVRKMWKDRTWNKQTNYTECAETLEVPHAFLCASYDRQAMLDTLTRAVAFVEGPGGVQPGTVIPFTHPVYKARATLFGGFDLKSRDLAKFYGALQEACSRDTSLCPTEIEKDFLEKFFLPQQNASAADFAVITFGIRGSPVTAREVVTHEMLHAQYFLTPGFAQSVQDFWNTQMSSKDRERVSRYLEGLRIYNMDDSDLVINEFQAYALAQRTFGNLGDRLEAWLRSAGLKPFR